MTFLCLWLFGIWQCTIQLIAAKCGFSAIIYLPHHTDLHLDMRILEPGIRIAFETVKNSTLQECEINVITSKHPGQAGSCDNVAANAAAIISETYYRWLDTPQPVALVLGTACSFATKEVADLATPLNFILMEGAGIATFLNDKKRYPTFIRWGFTQYKASQLVIQVMRRFRWSNIVTIWNDDTPIYRAFNSIVDSLKTNPDIHVDYYPYYPISRGPTDPLRVIVEVNKVTRGDFLYNTPLPDLLFISSFFTFEVVLLAGSPREIREMMVMAHEQGYSSGDHVYLAVAYFKTKNYFGIPEWRQNDMFDETARIAFQSLFLIKLSTPASKEFPVFEKQVEEIAVRDYNQSIQPYEEVNTHAIGFHDAVIAYGEVLNKTLRDGQDMFDGARLAKKFRNRTFYGMRGRMTLDSNNDLNGNYEIWSFDYNSTTWIKVIDFPEEAKFITQVAEINWTMGHPPVNEPICGFSGNNPVCMLVDETTDYAVGICCAVIGIVAITTVLVLRSIKRRNEQKYLHWWAIYPRDLSQLRWTQSRATLAGSVETIPENNNKVLYSSAVNTALYHGVQVYLVLNSRMIMTDYAKLELKKIRQIKCEKLVRIVGVCLAENLRSLVFDYCPRGAVYDLVQNAETYTFVTDWNLRFSLIRDIVEGLHYIHHSWLRSHGKLRSTKCLLDKRFVAKITDYTLRDLRPTTSGEYAEKKLNWMAPEMMTHKENLRFLPADEVRAADMYSLGMIMSEIIWLRDPEKPIEDWNTEKIAEFLEKFSNQKTDQPVSDSDQVLNSSRLAAQCLLHNPTRRPGVDDLQARLTYIAGDTTSGAAENLIARMAGYAQELERTVSQRTADLLEEQRTNEGLLFEILPKSIAQGLIRGKMPDPEKFDDVTVLFSCVEDFGDIVAESNPLAVVAVLNELYHLMDATISTFDAYKVETIADTYMVVSGLPVRNQSRHVSEISHFALSLLDVIKSFKISSISTLTVQLKIGFHTGNCMAAVIGKKMPRYCLFGDTINTASRMETTSEGGKIQLSEMSKEFLDKQEDRGSFVLTSRGKVFVKGKGDMQTYWLAKPDPME